MIPSDIELDGKVTGDTRPAAIIEARSHAFSGALVVQCRQRQSIIVRQATPRKPVESRLPFVLEKFVGVYFFALNPAFVIGERGGAFLLQARRNAIAPAMDLGRVRTARPSLPL